MSTLLFTGWTGYIGSHATVEFLEEWHEIIIIDNLSNSSREVLDSIEEITWKRPIFYEGDIRDTNILEKIFQSHAIDTVVHFAGLKAVGESCEKPWLFHDNNIIWSIVLFEVMEDYSVRNIVFSSSATVYAEDNPLPWKEDGKLATKNPYGTTKLVIEQILQDYQREKWWYVASLRYFNPIGAHKSWLIGENPQGTPNNLLPYIMQVVVGKESSVRVYGNDYDTPDGTWVRDYIHVVDLARGHLRAYDFICEHTGTGYCESFNLGTGRWTSVMEIIRLTSEVLGREVPYTILYRRPWDIAVTYCDPEKANNILSWKAEYDVRKAIEDSINFMKKSEKLRQN